MAEFGTFVYGTGVVYGPSVDATSIDIQSRNSILVRFPDDVVINDSYMNPANYSVTLTQGVGQVTVRRVLRPKGTTAQSIVLVTDVMTKGSTYEVRATGLNNRVGISATADGFIVARDTKTDSVLRSFPKHYDKTNQSNLFGALAAISASDDVIGGARSDDFLYGPNLFDGNVTHPPPVYTLASPVDQEVVPNDNTTLSGTYSFVTRIDILVDGEKVGEATLSAGSWSYTFAPSPAPVVQTSYDLRVVAFGPGGVTFNDTTFDLDPP